MDAGAELRHLGCSEPRPLVEYKPVPRRMNRAASGRVALTRIEYDPVAWDAIVADHPEAEVFHGAPWLDYLAATQGAEPVVAVVTDAGRAVGYFVGAIVRRFGLRILGSPLRGWATMYMGFLLEQGFDRRAAAVALAHFAFDDLGCFHVELADRWMNPDQMVGSGFNVERGHTFVVDLSSTEGEILSRMPRGTRYDVRRAGTRGLHAERAMEGSFADEYYADLITVFARQGLAPTYAVERVRQLIRSLGPTDGVLLMRVRAASGDSVATAIVVGRNETAVLWGAAFDRANAYLRPNELLHWEAMRYWRAKGILRYDMGGGGDYKAQYGGVETPTYWFNRSRYRVFGLGRTAVRRLVRARQIVHGRLARRAGPSASP